MTTTHTRSGSNHTGRLQDLAAGDQKLTPAGSWPSQYGAGCNLIVLNLTHVTGVQIPSASLRQELIQAQAHKAGEELSLCVKCYMGEKAVFGYVGENEHFLAQRRCE